MFNVAFVSCWTDLYESYQEDLTRNLQAALSNNFVPPDVISIILSLAEFMEHDEKALAIDASTLGDYVSTHTETEGQGANDRQTSSTHTPKLFTTRNRNSLSTPRSA